MNTDETARREAEGREEAETRGSKTEPPPASGPAAPAKPDDAEDRGSEDNRKGGYGTG